MRKVYHLLVAAVLCPLLMIAQKPAQKKTPNGQVSVNTKSGVATIKTGTGTKTRPLNFPQKSKKQTTLKEIGKKNFSNFIRMPLQVKLKSNTAKSKELFVFKASKTTSSFSKKLMNPQGYYASVSLTSQSDVDNFNTLYPACTSVGSLIIEGNSIHDISNLSAITDATVLSIKNTSLTNLASMTALQAITDSLVLENNGSLTSIGLSNVDILGGLVIRDMQALTSIDAFSSSLTAIANDVIINNSAITSLSGLSSVVNIGGDLKVTNSAIVSPGMTSLRTAGYIWYDNNPDMIELGLAFITKMNGLFLDQLPQITSLGSSEFGLSTRSIATLWLGSMPQLNDISYIRQFNSVTNIILMYCDALSNIDDFENITNCPYGIFIYANANLENISGLSGITTVEYDKIEISQNALLTSLSGLENILLTDALWLSGNSSLENLNDLNPDLQILNANGDDLQIIYNGNLSVCDVPAICNYLNSGNAVNPQIFGNTGNCNDVNSLSQACGSTTTCTQKVEITWNGNVSSDWTDPENWTPNTVPDACSIVIIPSGMPNDPFIEDDVTIGGLIMNSSWLFISDRVLTITDKFELYDSYIYDNYDYGYSTVRVLNAVAPKATYSSFIFANGNLEIKNFTGETDFYNNTVYGNLTMIDNGGRTDRVYTFGNEINGSLNYVNNGSAGNNYLSNGNADADHVYGNLTVKNNSSSSLSVGIGLNEPLWVEGNVKFEEAYPGSIYVGSITFTGSGFQKLTVPEPIVGMGRQMGTVEPSGYFEIQNFYLRKYYQSFLVPQQSFLVRQNLVMDDDQGVIISQADKMLILADNLVVTDEDPENGSFIEGPVKKMGDDAFTFPLGKVEGLPMFTGNQAPLPSGMMKKKSSAGYFKAPLSITAPSESNAAFIAEYKHTNPGSDGFDTSLKAPATGEILAKEYWTLLRDGGTSNVSVTLTYDQLHIEQPFTVAGLQIAGWSGSEWQSLGNSNPTGNSNRGTIQSSAPLTSYGPLALSLINVRKPIATILRPADTSVCKSTTFKVHFTLDTLAAEGSTFKVEISDENGNFSTSNTVLASKVTNTSDSISVNLPNWVTTGKSYKIRVVGSPQNIVSAETPVIIPIIAPQQTVTIAGADSSCLGSGTLRYYITGKEAGVQYNWSVTGGTFTVEQDTATITFTAAGNQQVKIISSNACGTGPSPYKSVKIKPAAPTATPAVTHTGRRLQAASPNVSQSVTHIEWYRNNVLITGADALSYYAPLAGNYQVLYANDCGMGPLSAVVSFAADALPQTITFDAIPDKMFGDEPFTLPATSSSGLPVLYQIQSGEGNITAGVFTITKSGTVTVKAFQPGDDIYDTAAPVTRTFNITKGNQTITWDNMPDYSFNGNTIYVTLPQRTSAGLAITYESASPGVFFYGNQLRISGVGNISITAKQSGNENYNAAEPVAHSFCVKPDTLQNITGAQYVCPGQEVIYRINKIPGITYQWRLSDGTVLPSIADTAKVTWSTTANYKIYVSAVGPCGPATAEDSLSVTVMDGVTAPVAVVNMLPQNGVIDQKLPLQLSWVPGNHTLSYDVFIWENGTSKPAAPFVANLTTISYQVSRTAGLIYDKVYNWQVVSKNGCLQTEGPVQTFRLRKATDLAVTQVVAPLTANSGQKITINWTVKNMGPGNTLINESWTDAVFLSFDTIPNLMNPALVGMSWSQLDFPVRPLLIATKSNVSALNAGDSYNNSIDFDIPRNYSQPLYVYVITNYNGGTSQPPQFNFTNDTARQIDPIVVTLTPTPDLRVDTVFTPATTFSGSIINVTYKVKNYGALTPSGSTWSDKLYISKSPLFVKKNATELKLSKANETYYPAYNAVIANNTLLQTDSTLARSVSVVVPNFISGTWFIHVVTNEDQKMYEGALAENNENNTAIQVLLTPTPQLTINSMNTPLTNVSTTQTIGVNWNVFNAGFYDNIEKNKGFYGRSEGLCNGGRRIGNGSSTSGINLNARGGGSETATVTVVPKEFDSLSWGSSYWVEKIYLSTDPLQLHTGTALFLGEVTKGIKDLGWYMPDDIISGNTHCGPEHGPVPSSSTANVLRPGSNHPNQFSFTVPNHLADGEYYIYVQTNATKTVFSYVDTPVIKRSAKITISRPDLTVSSLTVPTSLTGGVPFIIEYVVANTGAGSVYNFKRTDKIYMSQSPVYDGTAQLLKTITTTQDVINGTPATQSVQITLPNNTSGTRYFFVRTNADSTLAENNFNNNLSGSAMANVVTAPPVDLIVSAVTVQDTSTVPGFVKVKYEVKNTASNNAQGIMVDSLYISCSPTFNAATAIGIGSVNKERIFTAGSTITDSFLVFQNQAYLLNPCFNKADFSQVYFYVVTNTSQSLYEGTSTSNNSGGSGEKTLANRNLDFMVSNITAPATGMVGRPLDLKWTLSNIGFSRNTTTYKNQIVFSADSLSLDDAYIFNTRIISGFLEAGQTTQQSFTDAVPKMPTGDYYITVITDYEQSFKNEIHLDNNREMLRDANGKAIKVHIELPLLSDLVGEIETMPTRVPVGQPVTIRYKVNNNGAGDAYPLVWTDEVWLSKGLKPMYGDQAIGAVIRKTGLSAGSQYIDSVRTTIPMGTIPGNYMIIVSLDSRNLVIEENDTNNLALFPVQVYVPEPVDLTVPEVTAPDTVYLGYLVDSVRWNIQNNSSNPATGVSTDGIYISKKPVYDSTAMLIGLVNKNLTMEPLQTDALRAAPEVQSVPEGDYYIIVRTDILNNISETDKLNNEGATAMPVFVSVKEIKLGEVLADTMSVPKYYKLAIPDSLIGATILVTMKSKDSLTMRNEVYAGGGYIPSVLQWDYRFNTPDYGNQQVLISDITNSVYYLSVRSVSTVKKLQDITLYAEKLPFAILMSQTNRGGNGGSVTVKLTGSLFTDSMTAKLVMGGTTINATKVYYINSTVVYATFPLQGKPLGVYDIILTKKDLSEAILEDGFSIVSPDNGGIYATGMNTGPTGPGTQPGCDPGAPAGLNSQLVTELIVPDKVFAGWPFVIQINYSNPTNMDIPVQTRVLYNDYKLPMSLSKDLSNGNSSLVIEISESDGPPGVIRAGSSGTITIYSNTPPNAPAHDHIKFNLK